MALFLQDNIREAVQWLVRDSQAQDSLVFAFSGHGCMDVSHDQERDGILPSDYERVSTYHHPFKCPHVQKHTCTPEYKDMKLSKE